jgi:6-phosphogluconolactonase
LSPAGTFLTGGKGTGGKEPDFGLANARALVLNETNHLLFVVNPGSDDLSVFEVEKDGLRLVDRQSSGGRQPISVTVHGRLIYVLNAGGNVGGSDNITGFTVQLDGQLSPLAGSTRPLSAPVTGPAQVRFGRDGSVLAVTERSTNKIDTYLVRQDGLLFGPIVNDSDAETPFGFDFGQRNELFVADDFNDAIGAGALSSYGFLSNGSLRLISSSVPALQSGACWVSVSHDGQYVYLANTVSSAITLYSVDPRNGTVSRCAPQKFRPMLCSRIIQPVFMMQPTQNRSRSNNFSRSQSVRMCPIGGRKLR